MERQLSDFTVTELKALAYDQMAQLELAQNNLRAINQELSKRLQSQAPPQQQFPGRGEVVEPLPPGSIQAV